MQVADAYGNPVTSGAAAAATVTLAGPGDGGALQGTVSRPLAAGAVAFTGLSLASRAPSAVLTASASLAGLATTATSAPFNIAAGPAAQLVFVRQPGGGVAQAAWPQQPAVALADALGNTVDLGADASAAVTLSLAQGTGTLTGAVAQNAASGVADFGGAALGLDQAGAGDQLSAQASVAAGTLTATSALFAVAPGAGVTLAWSTQPAGAAAGVPFSPPPGVQILDAQGRPIVSGPDSSLTVTVAASSPLSATLTGTTGVVASGGTASFANLAPTSAGPLQLTATAATSAGRRQLTSVSVWVTPGPAAALALTTSPAPFWISGASAPRAPVVAIQDAYGNAVATGADATAAVAVALSGGAGTLTAGTSAVAASAGVASFAGDPLSIDLSGADKVLTFTKASTAGAGGAGPLTVSCAPFTVVAGPAAQLVFTTQPGSGPAGAALAAQPVVEIRDVAGNRITAGVDANAVISLAPAAGALAGTVSVNASAGVATFGGLSMALATSTTLVASKGNTSLQVVGGERGGPALSQTSASFTIAPAAASQLAFTVQPGGGVAGAALAPQPAVQVQDAFGNRVASGSDAAASVSLALVGGGALAGTAALGALAGQASFSGLSTGQAAASLTLRASATLAGVSRQATSAGFAVLPGAATRLAFAVQPGGGSAQTAWAQPPVVEVLDAYNNLITAGSDAYLPVSLALTGGTGSLAGATGRGAWAGLASFAGAGLAINLAGSGKLLTASATSSAGLPLSVVSAPLTIVAGAARQLAFTQQPGGGTAGAAWPIQPQVQVQDACGNPVTVGPDANVSLTLGHLRGAGGALIGSASLAASAGGANFLGLALPGADTAHRLIASKPDTTAGGGTPGLAATSANFVVVPAAASQLVFSGPPAATVAGTPLGGLPLGVQVQDPFGNLVASGADSSRSITLSVGSGTGSLAGTLTQSASGGVASFAGLSMTAAGSKQLTASATLGTGAAAVNSGAFTVAPAAASGLAFTAQPGGAASRVAWAQQPVVSVVDTFGNAQISGLDANRQVALTLSSGTGSLAGTAVATAALGVAAFTGLSIDVPGSKNLTAAAALTTGTKSVVSSGLTIAPGPAAVLDSPFTAGTGASYGLSNAQTLTLAGGTVALTAADQADTNSTQFGLGQGTGAVYDSGKNVLRLGTANGCSGLATNCATLDATWAPQYSNLLGYWRFDGSGSIANNASIPAVVGPSLTAHNANGTGMAYVTGKLGQGIYLDGIDDYLSMPSSFFPVPTFSFAGWVNLKSSANYQFVYGLASAQAAAYGTWWVLCTLANQWRFLHETSFGDPGIDFSAGQMALNAWTHLAVTYDGRAQSMFVNGNLVGTTPVDNSPPTFFAANNLIGTANNGVTFTNAIIDEFAFWKTALSATEVAALYGRQRATYAGTYISRVMDGLAAGQSWGNLGWNTTLPFLKELPSNRVNETAASYPGLSATPSLQANILGLWHFNERAVATASGGGDFLDDSGLGNYGTLTNTASDGQVFNSSGPFGRALSLINTEYVGTQTVMAQNPTALSYQVWVQKGSASYIGPIVGLTGNYTGGGSSNNFDRMLYYSSNGNIVFGVSGGSNRVISSPKTYLDNQWHHLVGTLGPGGLTLYVDGQAVNANATYNSGATNYTGTLNFGWLSSSFNGGGWTSTQDNYTTALIDESAAWGRVLGAGEVLALYRRGANRLKFQVRSCAQAGCADNPTWQGPDGTAMTYYSELNNVSGASILATPPNPSVTVAANRYFQYRTILESDDSQAQCTYPTQGAGGYPCSPELTAVTVSPAHYDSTSPSVANASGLTFNQVTSLTTTLGAPGCPGGVQYTFSYDNVHWFYYNGAAWVASNNTAVQSTTAAVLTPTVMATFAGQAGTGSLYYTVFLTSNGQTPCSIDDIALAVTQ